MSRRRKKRSRAEKKPTSGFKPRAVEARTEGQKGYIKAILDNYVVLCHGPAGTGKTHIAAGMAAQLLRKRSVERIVICRPVVGVGKDIGYLPGTMEEKVGPYLMPLFDEFSYYLEIKTLHQFLAERVIEIVPLSMMRGRTFNDSFVILDEAQNATKIELKLMLTRLGVSSKMVLSGDLGQSDLPDRDAGSFESAIERLQGLEGVASVGLATQDIVRHHLIGEIERRL